MPRLRREAHAAVAGVPAEFADVTNPAWSSPSATLDWVAARGLGIHNPVVLQLLDAGPATRRKYAIKAWLHANGCASERWPKLLDWHRVAEVPLPRGWESDSYSERLACVRADD